MYLCAAPSLMVRGLTELILVAVGLWVTRRHPRAGLLLMVAGVFALMGSFGGPLLECGGWSLAASQQQSGSDWAMGAVFGSWILWMLGPISQAVNTMLIVAAVAMLALELPERTEQPRTF
jgi:hypothetical protein